jgi:arylsulfatase A-like enzyme
MGALRTRREQLDYVNFYAHLHRHVDRKIGRVLAALGDPGDPESLRSRTVIVRTADHGEMGLSHGGLRQKTFNVYEETINVPLVVSNPVLFRRPAETKALASLIDLLPTMLDLTGASGGAGTGGLRGTSLTPLLAAAADPEPERVRRSPVDLGPALDAPPAESVQDEVHFTYDDHQAGTATREAPGQPNRIRAIRTATEKYAVYFDPNGRQPSEHEMYDLDRDRDERDNLVEVRGGEPRAQGDATRLAELRERLSEAMERGGTAHRNLRM